jgi:PhoH-like ATPase
MTKNFILDTNVLLHDPYALFSFADNRVILPIEVIEEIDSFKRDMNELGRNSRAVAQLLDGFREKGNLGEGVPLNEGGMLRIVVGAVETDLRSLGLHVNNRSDNRILSLAIDLQQKDEDLTTIIVSKDVNLRLKADAIGIPAEDYEVDHSSDGDVYTGWREVQVSADAVDCLRSGQPMKVDGIEGNPNEYLFLVDEADSEHTIAGRLDAEEEGKIVPLKDISEGAVGVFPLNLEQTFALDALLNDDVKLVSLTGKAGTGKTLLAVAAGLRMVFKEDFYNRLLIFRPTTPVGKDLGYLPGDINEKMRPWMQPVYDALEFIREKDKRSRARALPPDLMECEEILVEPLSYIRGRSIPHQFIIIDEAQNLTPLEVKTVITRVGMGTKIVLTGDPHQIDNPYVDSLSNGLVNVVDRFRKSGLAAHVGLVKGERSRLAETAADIL